MDRLNKSYSGHIFKGGNIDIAFPKLVQVSSFKVTKYITFKFTSQDKRPTEANTFPK